MSNNGIVSFHQLSNCDFSKNNDGYKWKFYATVDNKAIIKNVTSNQYLSLNVDSGDKFEIIGVSSKFGENLIKFHLDQVTSPTSGITTNLESKKNHVLKWDSQVEKTTTEKTLDIKIIQGKYIRHPKFRATHIQIQATPKENTVNRKEYITIDELFENSNIIQLKEYSGIEEFTISAVKYKSNSDYHVVSNEMRFYHNFGNYKFNVNNNNATIKVIGSPGKVRVKLTLDPKSNLYETIYATKILCHDREEMEIYVKIDMKHKTKDSIKTSRLWKISPVDATNDKDTMYTDATTKTINDTYEFIFKWDALKIGGDRFECQSCICYGRACSNEISAISTAMATDNIHALGEEIEKYSDISYERKIVKAYYKFFILELDNIKYNALDSSSKNKQNVCCLRILFCFFLLFVLF